jgi:hypothetical protein
MFWLVPPPIIRSAYDRIYSICYLSRRYCYLPYHGRVGTGLSVLWVAYVYIYIYIYIYTHTHTHTYRVSQEEGTKLRESVPYVKIYRYNPKHLYPKLKGYGDNGQRKVWSYGGSTHCTLSANSFPHVCPWLPCQITETPLTLLRQYSTMADYACHV